jgi:RNA polymerase sigma-70 factor (ECF subfamily)
VEAQLVASARSGDRQAFEALLRPLLLTAYNLAYSMLRDRTAAEDAVQEASLKAWRKIASVRPDSPTIRPWFLAIVANECRSARRRPWWRVIRTAEPCTGSTSNAEERQASRADLARELAHLDHRDREVVFLFYALDLPLEEVAQVLGITAAGAKSRLYRAIGRLRTALEPAPEVCQ